MPLINILLLGTPEIRRDQRLITIPRRMPRALLFYLAAHRNLVTREEVISVLWDEKPANQSRLRLNESLSRLRSSLPSPDLVIAEGDLIGLDFEHVHVDLHVFEDLIDQVGEKPWQIPNNDPLPEYLTNRLQAALDLWRGNTFMTGGVMPSTLAFDNWLAQTGNRLARLRGRALERLAEHAYIIRNLESALQSARLALENDEYNSNLHYRVMECLVEQGHLNQARKYYGHVHDMLQKELNIQPSMQLAALHARIARMQSDRRSPAFQKWKVHPSMKVPLFGRKDILQKMWQVFNQHKSLFILGEAGQGKTRLIQEYIKRFHPNSPIMVVSCQQLETNLPYQPLREAFREYVQPDEWRSLQPAWVNHLVRLLPELETIQTKTEVAAMPEDPAQAQADILEAIRHVFINLFQNELFFLVLDDAHLADEASLSTISYLYARAPFDHNGHLVVLARQEEQSSSFTQMLNSVGKTQDSEIISLRNLDSKDVADLTEFIFQSPPSQEFVENLLRSTAGNPLFVLETLRSILEENPEPDLTGETEIPLPESVYHLILSRVNQLAPATRAILENAAVIGFEFDLNTLVGFSNQNVEEIEAGIEQLEQRLILHPVPAHAGIPRYRFNHEKFRAALLISLSPAKAMTIHANLAEFLDKTYQPQQAAFLAYHYQQAGRLTKSYHYWIQAGNRARELYSISDLFRFFSQAEMLLADIEPTLPDEEIHRLYFPWYEMAYITHNTQELRRLGNDLMVLGRNRKSPLLIGTALDILSSACMTENKYKEGLDFATRAIPYLEKSENIFGHIEAYLHRGSFLYMMNHFDEAIIAFEKALDLGGQEDSLEAISARANAHYQISLIQTLAGRPQNGRQHALLSLEDANTSNRNYLQFSAYFVLALSSYYLGEYHQAREYTRIGINLAERTQSIRLLGYYHGYASAADLIMGKVDSALSFAKQTLQFGEEYELNEVIAMGCRHLADVYTVLRAPQQAIPYYQRGGMVASDHFLGLDSLVRLGYVQAISGQLETGQQTLAACLEAAKHINLGLDVIATEHLQSLVHLSTRNWQEAGRLALKVKEAAIERNISFEYISAIKSLAIIELNAGELDIAVEQLNHVAQEARSMGNIWLEIEALLMLEAALNRLDRRNPIIRLRLEEIKGLLAANTRDPSLQEDFTRFIQRIDQGFI